MNEGSVLDGAVGVGMGAEASNVVGDDVVAGIGVEGGETDGVAGADCMEECGGVTARRVCCATSCCDRLFCL